MFLQGIAGAMMNVQDAADRGKLTSPFYKELPEIVITPKKKQDFSQHLLIIGLLIIIYNVWKKS